jgi:hypothetical protein
VQYIYWAGNEAGAIGPEAQRRGLPTGNDMVKNFEDMQKVGKDNVEVTMKAFGATSKGVQAIAAEVTNYSKKAFEDGTQAMEKLFGAKTLEKAIEVQSEYAKTSYEGFVAQAAKLGELYVDLAREAYKPFEGYLAKVTPAK